MCSPVVYKNLLNIFPCLLHCVLAYEFQHWTEMVLFTFCCMIVAYHFVNFICVPLITDEAACLSVSSPSSQYHWNHSTPSPPKMKMSVMIKQMSVIFVIITANYVPLSFIMSELCMCHGYIEYHEDLRLVNCLRVVLLHIACMRSTAS